MIEVQLKAESRSLVRGFNTAVTTATNFGKAINGVRSVVARFSAAVDDAAQRVARRMAIIGASITAFFGIASKGAADFERAMRNVNTVAQLPGRSLRTLENQVLSLSTKLPQSAKELAEGLYQIVSSGFQAGEAMEILRASSIAATAGLTTTATAATAVVAILNAYGMGAGSAADVSDILFETVNRGVITFEQLANGVGEWVGMAATLRIRVSEASAAIAAMTLNGLSADRVQTNLSRTMEAFIRPSESMTRVVKQLGYESAAALVQERGLTGAIRAVVEQVGTSAPALRKLFQEINALEGVLAISANGFDAMGRSMAAIDDRATRAGAAQAAYREQAQTTGFALEKLGNAAQRLRIIIGREVNPVVRNAANFMAALANSAAAVPAPIYKVVGVFTAIMGLGLGVGGVLLMLKIRSAALALAFKALTGKVVAREMFTLSAGLGAAAKHFPAMVSGVAGLLGHVPGLGNFAAKLTTSGSAARFATAGVKALTFAAAHAGPIIAGLTVGISAAASVMGNAKRQANELVEELGQGQDDSSFEGISDHINALIKKYGELHAEEAKGHGIAGGAREFAQNFNPFARNSITDAEQARVALEKEINKLLASRSKMRANILAVQQATGLEQKAVEELARSLGIDLTNATERSVQKMIEAHNATKNETAALEELEAASELAAQKVDDLASALAGFTDLGTVMGDLISENNELGKTGKTAADRANEQERANISLARAQRDLIDATNDLNKAKARSIELDKEKAAMALEQAILNEEDAVAKLAEAEDTLARIRAAGGSPEAEAAAVRAVRQGRINIWTTGEATGEARTENADAQSGAARSREITELTERQREAVIAVADAQKQMAEAGKEVAEKMGKAADAMNVSLNSFTKRIEEQNKSAQEWEDNLFKIIKRGAPLEVVDQLLEMGVEGAGIVKKFANATPAEFERLNRALTEKGRKGTKEYADTLRTGLTLAVLVAQNKGSEITRVFMDQVNLLPGLLGKTAIDIQSVAQKFGFTVQVIPGGQTGATPAAGAPTLSTPIAGPPNPNVPGSRIGAPDAYAPPPPPATIATGFGVPDASDYGVGRTLSGEGGQPWSAYVPDPAWNVSYYDPGNNNQFGLVNIHSAMFGGYAGQFTKTREGVWVWYGATPGAPPPPLSSTNPTPGSKLMASGGFSGDRRAMVSDQAITWAEAGREAYIPLGWDKKNKAQTHAIFQQTARELGYAVTRMAGGGIVGSPKTTAPSVVRQVIYVPVPERWVAPTNVDVHGVDPESAMRWGQAETRRKASIRPGRGST